MKNLVLSNILRFVGLILLQILILNFVYLGGYMLPFVYILAVLMLPTRMSRVWVLVVAFAAGAVVDIFCNVPGFHAFSCTMMAFFRLLVGNRILTRGEPIDIDVPGAHNVPFQQLSGYLLVMSMVYSVTYFLIESFTLGNFWWMVLAMALSTLVTWLFMLLCQLFVGRK